MQMHVAWNVGNNWAPLLTAIAGDIPNLSITIDFSI